MADLIEELKAAASWTSAEAATVTVDGADWTGFTDLHVVRSLDSFSTWSLSCPDQWEDAGFREAFRPFGFQSVSISSKGRALAAGTMMASVPQSDGTRSCEGYGAPGVLADCQLPPRMLPAAFDGLTLEQIAQRVAEPFGLAVQYDGPEVQVPAATVEPTDTALDVITRLSREAGLLVSDTRDGKLWIQSVPLPGDRLPRLTQGDRPLVDIAPEYDAQKVFSDVTALQPVSGRSSGDSPRVASRPSFQELFGDQSTDGDFARRLGRQAVVVAKEAAAPIRLPVPEAAAKRAKAPAGQSRGRRVTVENPHVSALVTRPHVFRMDDGATTGPDACLESAQAAVGRMWGGAATWKATVAGWRDDLGNVWEPGQYVSVLAPMADIHQRTAMMIRTVELPLQTQQAILHLVLPCAFGGSLPPTMPWDF